MVVHLLLYLHSNPYSIKKTAEIDKSSQYESLIFYLCHESKVHLIKLQLTPAASSHIWGHNSFT